MRRKALGTKLFTILPCWNSTFSPLKSSYKAMSSIFDAFTQELTSINEVIVKSIADYPKAAETAEGKEKVVREMEALFSQVLS